MPREGHMKRPSSFLLAVIGAVVGWFLLQQAQTGGWKGIKIPGLTPVTSTQPPPPRGNEAIRIASFNIQVFGETKVNNPEVMQVIVAILRNFDLIAIQEVRSISPDVLPQLIGLLNADGHH